MITETGRVVALHGEQAWIETINAGSCAKCSLQAACGQRLLSAAFGRTRHLVVNIAAGQTLRVDARVEVGIPETGLLKAAVLAYLVPLLGLLLGATGGQQLAGEGGAVLGAVGGLVLALAGVRLLLNSSRLNISEPKLLRCLPASIVSSDSF